MDRDHLLNRAVLLSVASIGISAIVGTAAVVVALATESLSLLGFGADAVIDSAASSSSSGASGPRCGSRIGRIGSRRSRSGS